jgi:hypothetical protein
MPTIRRNVTSSNFLWDDSVYIEGTHKPLLTLRPQVHLNNILENQLNQSLTHENVSILHDKEKSGNARKLSKAAYLVLYLYIEFSSHLEENTLCLRPNRLTLFTELIAVYCDNHKKNTNTLCGQKVQF